MQHVLRVSILELLRLTGFQSAHASVLDVLVDALERYLREMALSTRASSELSSRCISNVDDVALAFKKYGVTVEDLVMQLDLFDEVELPFMPPQIIPVRK